MTEIQRSNLSQSAEELMAFLDERAQSVRQMLEQLNQLRAAVIRRDEQALRQMQEILPLAAAQREQADSRQQQICHAFSRILECRPEEVNLTRVGQYLMPEQKTALLPKQRLLKELMNRLSLEHCATEQLLRECERLNRTILEGIIGKRNQTLTYTSYGQTRREVHQPIISMRM
ncbi:MAG: hypothetical protein JXB18_10830 [Sedimentisphaerales bacterium]|nr:hypothetical protein [Sedimentisphaerales bacterium]